jgi:hypothetical protein
MVQGIPCRAAVRAVAHPATPEPRISKRSCGAEEVDEDRIEVVDRVVDWLRVVVEVTFLDKDVLLFRLLLLLLVANNEVLRPPPTTAEEKEMDEKHLTSPTYELHRIPDELDDRLIIRWMVVLMNMIICSGGCVFIAFANGDVEEWMSCFFLEMDGS